MPAPSVSSSGTYITAQNDLGINTGITIAGTGTLLLVVDQRAGSSGSNAMQTPTLDGVGLTQVGDNGQSTKWVIETTAGSRTLRTQTAASAYDSHLVSWRAYQDTISSGARYAIPGSGQDNSGTSTAPSSGTLTCPAGGAIDTGYYHGYCDSLPTISSGTAAGGQREAGGGQAWGGGTRTSTGAISWTAPNSAAWLAVSLEILGEALAGTTLSSPVGTATGKDAATVGATADTASGTIFAVASSSATAPTGTQIEAGQDHTGSAADDAGSVAVSSIGAKTIALTAVAAAARFAHLVHKVSATYSNIVTSAAFTPSVLAYSGTIAAQAGTQGAAFSWSGANPSTLFSGGIGSKTITASGLGASGLTANSSTGVLSGTCGTPGTYSVTLTSTDQSTAGSEIPQTEASNAFDVVIAASGGGTTFSGTVPSKSGTVGVVFDFGSPTMASYFSGTGTYALLSGTLPPGLTVNASTGAVQGTPTTAGTYASVVVRKTATSGSPATADTNAFTITISATPGTYTATVGPFGNAGIQLAAGVSIYWTLLMGDGPGGGLTVAGHGTGTTDAGGNIVVSHTVAGNATVLCSTSPHTSVSTTKPLMGQFVTLA